MNKQAFATVFKRSVNRISLVPALLSATVALAGTSAQAGVVLSYPSFAGTCGFSLTCVGNTAESGTALRVTPAAGGQSGAAYSTTPITLGASATFSTTFQFQFTNPGGIDPADGITFVLAKSPTGLGVSGGGLGYQGVANSVAIEFDTFNNGGADLSSNHVAIDTNGVLTNTASSNPYGVATCDFGSGYTKMGCMSNGDVWTASIAYDGAHLTVNVKDGANPVQTLIGGYAIDIASLLGTNTAFVGFTGGTGSGFENQDILNWQLANDTSLVPSVPEPSSLALMSIALAGLVAGRRGSRKVVKG